MLTIVVVITTMILIEQWFTVWVDEWYRDKYWYAYDRTIDIFYRAARVFWWFTFTLVLAHWGCVFIPITFYLIAFMIKRLYILSLDK